MFNKLTKLFIILLPFNVLLSVFFQFKLGLNFILVYKEVLVLVLLGVLVFKYFKLKKMPVFDKLDYLIFGYFGYLLLISLVHFSGLKAIFYGARYDFMFLLVFLIFRHGAFLLQDKLSYYVKLFLTSGGAALFIGMLVRFVFKEDILIHFGFSPVLSSWSIGQSIPIYHGIEGASVRRFQGIFDGPNQTAFFIILYGGLLIHYLKQRKEYAIYLFFGLFLLFGLIFLTYSRSSLLGIFGASIFLFLLNIKKVFKKYKSEFIVFTLLVAFVGSFFYLRYGNNVTDIVLRAGSSKGHSERMIIGFKQFTSNPLGYGLASNGPAYRSTHDISNIDEKNYIPESWYIQQLVEGGVTGFLFFISIMTLILFRTYFFSIPITGGFLAILMMNIFLHTFEAVYVSLILFMFLGMIIKPNKNNKSIKFDLFGK